MEKLIEGKLYEMVEQTHEEEKKNCGGCEFLATKHCSEIPYDVCTHSDNLNKVFKLKNIEK